MVEIKIAMDFSSIHFIKNVLIRMALMFIKQLNIVIPSCKSISWTIKINNKKHL